MKNRTFVISTCYFFSWKVQIVRVHSHVCTQTHTSAPARAAQLRSETSIRESMQCLHLQPPLGVLLGGGSYTFLSKLHRSPASTSCQRDVLNQCIPQPAVTTFVSLPAEWGSGVSCVAPSPHLGFPTITQGRIKPNVCKILRRWEALFKH